jgi:hypothetical protein
MSQLFMSSALHANVIDELPESEFLRQFAEAREGMVNRAWMTGKKDGQSWRDFRVGAALLGYWRDAPIGRRWRVKVAANVKVTENARPLCAEVLAGVTAAQEGCDCLYAAVVVGPPQADLKSGRGGETLHMCSYCQQTLSLLKNRRGKLIMSPQARILSVRVDSQFDPENPEETVDLPEKLFMEEMSFEELLALHGNGHHAAK